MRAPLPILAFTAICALFRLAVPFQAAPAAQIAPAVRKKPPAPNKPEARKKPAAKKKPRRTTAQVTAAMRAAALNKVIRNLVASANLTLRQPGAFAPVFEQLLRLTSGQSHDPVHILHFGDSHTAADQWTGGLRDLFQQRFGDGGSGFSVAGHPFAGYRRFDARSSATAGWQSEGLRKADGDGYYGLGGISIVAWSAGQSVAVDADCDRIEIDYLQQPGGGGVELYDGDQPLQQFSTDGDLAPAFVTYEIPAGPHHFVLRTLEARPVRLFGWVADRDGGVTYEALGINGAEAAVMLRWNQDMLATYLQRRNPALIVLAYGANEASDSAWDPASYQAMYSSLLEKLRAAAPAASILAIGPGDRWARYRGVWKPVPGIDWVIAAQRAACKANGCAFWDTRERMGGKGSMPQWVVAGLGQVDRVHFTDAGYHRLATALFEDLMSQYDVYQKARTESEKEGNGRIK
jgi:lysophospholipase L1-like esterase